MKVLPTQKNHKISRKKPFWLLRALTVPIWFVMLIQPIAPVFASEEISVPETPPTEVVSNDTPVASPNAALDEVVDEITVETELLSEDQSDVDVVDNTSIPTSETVVVESVTETNTSDTPVSESTQEGELIDTNENLTAEDLVLETTDESSQGVSETPEQPEEILSSSTPETLLLPETDTETLLPESPTQSEVTNEIDTQPDESEVTVTATTTEVDAPLTVINHVAVSDENLYSFSRNECAMMGDGVFYCTRSEVDDGVLAKTDGVYAAQDADGDREIFITDNGETVQITSNVIEDDAPFYDEASNTVVWHRLIDGRYQIVSYDLGTNEEVVLTNDRFNNMHPTRDAELLVWQAWVGDDWEIMLDKSGELKMITDNTVQDISPRINGNYIVWQSFEDGAWRVKVYDQTTGSIDTIADSAGASVQNPRFVLVYDAEHENGDVETLGYDLEEKVTVPLSATPAPLPQELPSPEQTGEERALVQPTTTVKQKVESEGDAEPPTNEPTVDDVGTASSTDEVIDEIVIPPFVDSNENSSVLDNNSSSSNTNSQNDTGEAELPVETNDVVIPSLESAHPPIEDLIITPYVESIEEIESTTDSQSTVASST